MKFDPIDYIQRNADKQPHATLWAYQVVMPDEQASDCPVPTTVYESARAALGGFMRAYELTAPLDWIIETQIAIQADWREMRIRIFGMHAATPTESAT